MSRAPEGASEALAHLDEDEVRAEASKGYAWETRYQRSWDQIAEDPETGRLKSFEKEKQVARKRSYDDGIRAVRRGMIRYCILALDLSAGMDGTDLKPSRGDVVGGACEEFLKEYFDQNPISQISVIATRDGVAARLSGLGSNTAVHVDAIQEGLKMGTFGEASLQNILNLARKIVAPIPAYGSKEVLVVYGSLSTCDPGNIHNTIAALVKEKIRCSAVGLGAELHILKALAEKTGGTYTVAMNEEHFSELLSAHVVPPPTTSRRVVASLIRMGFPMLKSLPAPRVCFNNMEPRKLGYECPRCKAWLSDIPMECTLCGLALVSSPHLARSYHHLFPAVKYMAANTEQGDSDLKKFVRCYSCLRALQHERALRLICPRCRRIFCIDCDSFIHDVLHNCPGCESAGLRGEESLLIRLASTPQPSPTRKLG